MRVAQAFATDPMTVATRPFAATVWSFLALLEIEEFEQIGADAASLQQANRLAIAFHEPKKLEDERRELLNRVQVVVPGGVAAAKARGLRLVEQLRKDCALEDPSGR